MSDDDVVFVRQGLTMHVLTRSSFESEDLLQELIAKHPHVLAGAQISGDPAQPIRWLLVRREAAIPDTLGGAARWAVDHLLLDQDGRPTFVEVKRSNDTRIRREVVGQMLDYAANRPSTGASMTYETPHARPGRTSSRPASASFSEVTKSSSTSTR